MLFILPHHLELIDILKRVQKHFIKRLHGLNNLSYGDRLNIVGLHIIG